MFSGKTANVESELQLLAPKICADAGRPATLVSSGLRTEPDMPPSIHPAWVPSVLQILVKPYLSGRVSNRKRFKASIQT